MKKIFFMWSLCALLLSACNGSSAHKGQEDEHEGHNHEAEAGEHKEGGKEKANPDEIVFPKVKADAIGLKAEVMQPRNFNQVIQVSGQVLAAQGDESTVVATAPGIVTFKTTLTEGTSIAQGKTLLVVSSKNIKDGHLPQNDKITYEIAKQDYERGKALLASKIISEKDYNQLRHAYESARIVYNAISQVHSSAGQAISSNMSGYLKSLLVKEGDYVTVGQPLLNVTKNRRLFLRAEVSERYYSSLKGVSSANFKTPYDDRVYRLSDLKGRLVSFGKASDANSFYVPITFEFDNRGGVVPGSFVEVYLLSTPIPNVISVPRAALTEASGLFFVYIQLDEDCYRKQEVKLGVDNGSEVQIVSGLKAGDKVVTCGAYQVKLASASSAIPAHSHEH